MNAKIRSTVSGPHFGTKTVHEEIRPKYKLTMNGLHNPAWWSCLRLISQDHPHGQFRVRLLKSDGMPVFDNGRCEWIQNAAPWYYLPWAIPATMADSMGIYFEITSLDTTEPTFVVLTIGFHEMPQLSPYDRYLFVLGDGSIQMAWDGHTRSFPEPAWGERHLVITHIANNESDTVDYYPMDWQNKVPVVDDNRYEAEVAV